MPLLDNVKSRLATLLVRAGNVVEPTGANIAAVLDEVGQRRPTLDYADYHNNLLKVRKASVNYLHAQGYLNHLTTGTIGTAGIRLEYARDTTVADAFNAWMDAADITGRSVTGADFLRLVAWTLARDGECWVEIVDASRQLCLIDTEQIPYGSVARKGKDGIEFDANGTPTGYYVQPAPSVVPRLVPANRMLHIFTPRYAKQWRGTPPLLPALEQLKVLDQYDYEVLLAARNSASLSTAVVQDTPEFVQKREDKFGTPGSPGSAMQETFTFGNGRVPMLGPGYKLAGPNIVGPWAALEHLHYAVLTAIAASLGVSYYGLSADVSRSNYTAHRAGQLIEREVFAAFQQKLVSGLMIPAFRYWGDKVRLLSPAAVERMLSEATWAVQQPSPIDPIRQANADKIQAGMFTKSLSEIIRERGAKPEQVFKEIAADYQSLKAAGLTDETLASLFRSMIVSNQSDDAEELTQWK